MSRPGLGEIKVDLSGACSGWVWDKSRENQPKAMTTTERRVRHEEQVWETGRKTAEQYMKEICLHLGCSRNKFIKKAAKDEDLQKVYVPIYHAINKTRGTANQKKIKCFFLLIFSFVTRINLNEALNVIVISLFLILKSIGFHF